MLLTLQVLMSVFLWFFRGERSSLPSISYTLHLSTRQIAVTQGEKQEVNVGVTSGPAAAHFPRRRGRLVDFYFWSLELLLPAVVVKTWRTDFREQKLPSGRC